MVEAARTIRNFFITNSFTTALTAASETVMTQTRRKDLSVSVFIVLNCRRSAALFIRQSARPCSILIESKLGPSLLFNRDFRAVKCSISLETTLDPVQFRLTKIGGLIYCFIAISEPWNVPFHSKSL